MAVYKKEYNAKKGAVQPVPHLSMNHHLSVSSDATAGTLTITAKAPGSTIFEPIVDAVDLDITAAPSIQVVGVIAAFNFALTGDDATKVVVTHAYEA